MPDLELQVTIDPKLPRELADPVVAFGEFTVTHPEAVAYKPGAEGSQLSRLYVDLLCGRPLPLHLVARHLSGPSFVIATALFLDRQLALSPKFHALVSAVELSALGTSGLAHIDRDLARFLIFVERILRLTRGSGQVEMSKILESCVIWVRDYLESGTLPAMPPPAEPPKVLQTGSQGFVVAHLASEKALQEGLLELYRDGFLRGLVFSGAYVWAFRKSSHLQMDFVTAVAKLNEMEEVAGGAPEWAQYSKLLIECPPKGTKIPVKLVQEVIIRA